MSVFELRQYTLRPGRRDDLARLPEDRPGRIQKADETRAEPASYLVRPPERLRLAPTARSALR